MMTHLKHGGKDYWLGLIDDRGIFVYDPAIQRKGRSGYVLLYEVNQCRLVQMAKDTARGSIRPCRGMDSSKLHESIRAFLVRDNLIERRKELEKQARAAAERFDLENKHREFVARYGISAHMVRLSNSKHRITHCHCCRNPLDSEREWGCSACRWILCNCGACGCGYRKP